MVSAQDETGETVASGTGPVGQLPIEGVHLWQPRHAYLYTCVVELWQQGRRLDTYEQPFGVRTLAIKDGKFLINGKPFYFKGFGRHEDSQVHGRGFDEVLNVKDFNLLQWIGGNSPQATTSANTSFFDLDIHAVDSVLGLNFTGTFQSCQIFGRDMAKRKQGVIVNIVSMNALRPLTRIPAYSAAIANFTQWLAVHMAQEFSPSIRVKTYPRI